MLKADLEKDTAFAVAIESDDEEEWVEKAQKQLGLDPQNCPKKREFEWLD